MAERVVHRWQPTGKTPCGRFISPAIVTNTGRYLNDGVTCRACKRARTLVSIYGRPHGWTPDGAGEVSDAG